MQGSIDDAPGQPPAEQATASSKAALIAAVALAAIAFESAIVMLVMPKTSASESNWVETTTAAGPSETALDGASRQ